MNTCTPAPLIHVPCSSPLLNVEECYAALQPMQDLSQLVMGLHNNPDQGGFEFYSTDPVSELSG